MKILFCILLLTGAAFAQGQRAARAVEPVRVNIITEDSAEGAEDKEFHKLFRAELNKHRDIVLRDEGYEFAICLTATKLVEKGRTFGYAAATLVITKTGRGDKLRFSIDTGPDLKSIAAQVVSTLYGKELSRWRY